MKLDLELDDQTLALELTPAEDGLYRLSLDGQLFEVELLGQDATGLVLRLGGRTVRAWLERRDDGCRVTIGGEVYDLGRVRSGGGARGRRHAGPDTGRVVSPMPGKVTKVLVQAGDEVVAGQALLVLEAMKMENELRAAVAGKVARVHVEAGQPVAPAQLLIEFE
jgi:acetyl/propionyl-CoA carboxylase alpha subunit